MSDYVTGLRQDLVEAAERQQQRHPAARAARGLHPRLWSPPVVLGAAAALAAVLLLVTLRSIGPAPEPTDAQIVETVRLGGHPRDAVAVGGVLMVADYDGRLYRLPLDAPDERTEVRVGGQPVSVARDGRFVWVVAQDAGLPPYTGPEDAAPHTWLYKLSAGAGEVLARVRIRRAGDAVVAGAVGAWLPAYVGLASGLENVPPPPVHPPYPTEDGLVVAARSVWSRSGTTVYEHDGAGRLLRRVPGVSPTLSFGSQQTIVPDAAGAWVVGQADGTLDRIDGEKVTRRVKLGRTAGVLARVGTSVWVSATSRAGQYELVRVNGGSGMITGRVRLGRAAPQTIVPVGDRLWVITSGGDALLVSPE